MFREYDRHQFLPISHSLAMTELVFHDAVVVFFGPPASWWLASIFSLNMECCNFLCVSLISSLSSSSCTKRIQPARGWCATVGGDCANCTYLSLLSGGLATQFFWGKPAMLRSAYSLWESDLPKHSLLIT